MPPPTLSTLYTDQSSVEALLSVVGVQLRVDDDESGTISPTEQTWIDYSISFGTSFVNRYAAVHYDTSSLAGSWSVWNWATIAASRWLCTRRGNSIPAAIAGWWEETKTELEQVRDRTMYIDDAALRNTASPVWSVLRLDGRYIIPQLRVIRSLSEPTPAQFPQNYDGLDAAISEPPIPW